MRLRPVAVPDVVARSVMCACAAPRSGVTCARALAPLVYSAVDPRTGG
jgi:hypothetical protein